MHDSIQNQKAADYSLETAFHASYPALNTDWNILFCTWLWPLWWDFVQLAYL